MNRELLERHHAWVASDTTFRRRARLHQALWRESKGFPIGYAFGKKRGDRLAMPWARQTLANYLTANIRNVVKGQLLSAPKDGSLLAEPRIYDSLLSSQPLCFNLFGELASDPELATRLLQHRVRSLRQVEELAFEYSPGRRDPTYTGDGTALDVFIAYTTTHSTRAFVGIEVKYSEALSDDTSPHRSRYDQIAFQMGIFKQEAMPKLRKRPLQQLWRDHLLVGSMTANRSPYEFGTFVITFPRENRRCAEVVNRYRECLLREDAIAVWFLEDIIDDFRKATRAEWVELLAERYLV